MRIALLLSLLAVSGCVQPRVQVAALSPAEQSIQREVEQAVVKRFGAAALTRARAADQFIAVLRYPGLPMPPYDTDGKPIEP
jgi:hypothetical protein